MVYAQVGLKDWEDILGQLSCDANSNLRWMRKNRPIPVTKALFRYKLQPPNSCGAEPWYKIWELLEKGEPPYFIDCNEAGPIQWAYLVATGEDPKARIRLIQFGSTAHVQIVSKKRVVDPSAEIGMPIPPGLERKIFDLNFWSEL